MKNIVDRKAEAKTTAGGKGLFASLPFAVDLTSGSPMRPLTTDVRSNFKSAKMQFAFKDSLWHTQSNEDKSFTLTVTIIYSF